MFLLFARVFPVIAQSETKSILKEAGSQYYGKNRIEPEPKAVEMNKDTITDTAESANEPDEIKTDDE